MKRALASLALFVPLAASAVNLLNNGSFETFEGPQNNSFSNPLAQASWVVTNIPNLPLPATPVSSLVYGSASPGAFFTTVPADTFTPSTSSSPDFALGRGVYFVDDNVTSALTQSFTVPAGGNAYIAGFDYYLPVNGFNNSGSATLTIAGLGFTKTFDVQTNAGLPGVWHNFEAPITLNQGTYNYHFFYVPFGGGNNFASDFVVDRAFVVAVPEPGTYALFAAGLLAIGFMARRRSDEP